MASSGNFPLWSPLIKGAVNLSQGNTRFDGSTSNRGAMTSFAIPTGTKFYIECLVEQATNYNIVFGIANPEFDVGSYDETDASMNGILFRGNNASSWDTCSLTNGSRGSFGSDVGQTAGRVLAMTVNRVDNEIKMYLDNSLQHTISISATEVYHIVCSFTGGSASAVHMNINCGHDSTGASDFSAGGNADANGFGDFQHSPPSGFLAACSANLPISEDIDPAQTDDDYPSKQFGVVLYTGNGSSNAISGLGFQPDLVWGKCRSHSQASILIDSSRGQGLLFSSLGNAEQTSNGPFMTSYDSDGFTLASSGSNPNDSGRTYVAWCWRANGASTSSNSNGSITSTVQANTKGGFSIITYTGTGSNATIGHGLSAKPDLFMVKDRARAESWNVYHSSMGATKYIVLDTHAVAYANSNRWNDTEPTTTTISLGTNDNTNGSSTYVCYAWHNVSGMQHFGSYEGNGDADGTFVYTGFRPRMVFLKSIDGGAEWTVFDTARETHNQMEDILQWDLENAETQLANDKIDFLSNGFKLRGAGGGRTNQNGHTYIYGAWGSVPFKYNNTF